MNEEYNRKNKAVINGNGTSMKILTSLLFISLVFGAAAAATVKSVSRPPYLPFRFAFAAVIVLGVMIAGISPGKATEDSVPGTVLWKCGTIISRIGCVLLAVAKILELFYFYNNLIYSETYWILFSVVELVFTLFYCTFIFIRADDAAGTLKGRYAKTGAYPSLLSVLWLLAGIYYLVFFVLSMISTRFLVYLIIVILYGNTSLFMYITVVTRALLFAVLIKWYTSSKTGNREEETDDHEL